MLKTLLAALPFEWKVGLAVAGLVGLLGSLGGAYLYVDHQGYRRATLEWQVKYDRREAELKKQLYDEIARRAAIDTAIKQEEEQAAEAYRLQLLKANYLTLQLSLEAAKDPNAGNIALDAEAIARHKRRIAE